MSKNGHFADTLAAAAEQGIRTVDLQFVDIFGNIKFKTVSFDEFLHEKEYLKGYGVDGSSIDGYGVPVEESDLLIMPDPNTFGAVPWAPDVSRVICDIHTPTDDGSSTPFEGDSRSALRRMLDAIPDALNGEAGIPVGGVTFEYHVAPELEFFVLDGDSKHIDHLGYFDAPTASMRQFLTEVMEAMNTMGIKYEVYHHEVAPSQFEFDFRYGEALEIADAAVTLKDIIWNYASRNEMVATFMPKPFFGMNGSGMHCHLNLSMYEGSNGQKPKKTNLFYDPAKEDLSDLSLWFIGGLIAHAPAITAITNPICNSYKRLVPGWEAPVNIAWGRKNRTALIRVPHGDPRATRCEYRSPDPSCNPYLVFAVTLAAGLDGIQRQLDPGEATERDLFHDAGAIATLPGSLEEALDHLEQDTVIQNALGPHIYTNFLASKREECQQYRARPSNIDFEMYLNA
ncbi:MAG: glutamine synthetase [Kiritimatiellae bacterium]|nr:glutamine synthetase [Kiritimatiellia bacterium]